MSRQRQAELTCGQLFLPMYGEPKYAKQRHLPSHNAPGLRKPTLTSRLPIPVHGARGVPTTRHGWCSRVRRSSAAAVGRGVGIPRGPEAAKNPAIRPNWWSDWLTMPSARWCVLAIESWCSEDRHWKGTTCFCLLVRPCRPTRWRRNGASRACSAGCRFRSAGVLPFHRTTTTTGLRTPKRRRGSRPRTRAR